MLNTLNIFNAYLTHHTRPEIYIPSDCARGFVAPPAALDAFVPEWWKRGYIGKCSPDLGKGRLYIFMQPIRCTKVGILNQFFCSEPWMNLNDCQPHFLQAHLAS